MTNKISTLLSVVAISVLSACSNTNQGASQPLSQNQLVVTNNALTQSTVSSVLQADLEQLWSQNFNHYQDNLLGDVANAIILKAKQGNLADKDLEKLSFYLRVYSSFGPDKDWPEATAQSLNQALIAMQNMPGFYQLTADTAKLHENYAVALYRLYFLEPLQPMVADHIQPLTKLINLYANTDLGHDKLNQYALWEVIRAGAILPYEARRKNKDQHMNAILAQGELQQALIDFIGSKNAVIANSDWPTQHAVWALAQYYNVYNKQYWNEYYKRSEEDRTKLDKDEMSLPQEALMTALDESVWSALEAFAKTHNKDTQELKTLFSIPYVVSTFRGKSECKENSLKGRCIAPTIEEALPIKHVCSDSLYILTQKMTEAQLNNSCQELIAQESDFHAKLATNNQPVANDFNDQLRVVIFHNAAEYNKYGQLVFDIHTDNGGMYIEGTTQDPDNTATFYSYEHFWVRPEFKVWNLHHEYVHYLDGRFVKYDTFNHFPSNLVWWSEGLAEYISKADDNPKAFKELVDKKPEEWLSLTDVFNTEYKDGTTQVYQWGYLAVRFMYEEHHDEYLKLAHYLKTDFFGGYKKLLDESGEKFQESFYNWLVKHQDLGKQTEETKDPKKPRQFYRYTYKDYLQPEHLVETPRHMHWQYWHENALKAKGNAADK